MHYRLYVSLSLSVSFYVCSLSAEPSQFDLDVNVYVEARAENSGASMCWEACSAVALTDTFVQLYSIAVACIHE
jgi:hypothetical protein